MAFSVIKYNSLESLLELKFSLDQHEKWKVVCPNPVLADAFREKLSLVGHNVHVETTTISKYLSELLMHYFPEKKVYRKSELFLMMATIWKMRFSSEDPSLFHQAFEILTDLRSFTLNKELIENILQQYHPVVAQAVKTFWLIMEDQEILDEHQAYHDLNEALLSPYDETIQEGLEGVIFLGFTHLSANQIEVFRSLGKTRGVLLPIPKPVLEKAQWTDWVKWVETQADEFLEDEAEVSAPKAVELYSFPKGRGNSTLKKLLSQESGHVLFFKKRISFKEALEAPTRKHFFRSDLNAFSHLLTMVRNEVEDEFLHRDRPIVESEKIRQFLQEKLRNFRGNSFSDFKLLKVYQLVYKELLNYVEFSETNENFGSFDFDILWQVIELNLPRNFNIPIQKETNFSLLSLNETQKIKKLDPVYFYIEGEHDLKGGGGANYPTEVQEILFSLGPMRRSSLDIEFHIFTLKEILGQERVKLVMESGMLAHDQTLNLLFDGQELVEGQRSANENSFSKPIIKVDLSNYKIPEKISASRLQTYIDCPRKYYFSYIEKLGEEPKRKESIDPRLLGEAEHEIVDLYLKRHKIFEKELHLKLVEEVSRDKFSEAVLSKKILKEEIQVELINYSQFLILEILKLKTVDPDLKWDFELPLDSDEAVGFIDLVITSPKFGTIILDMKRSGSSIPDPAHIKNFTSIQVLYYLKYYKADWSEYAAFGYINLSDLSQSLIHVCNSDLELKLKEVDFLSLETVSDLGRGNKDYIEFFEKFDESLKEIMTSFKNDCEFQPVPKDVSACAFCPGTLICDRGTQL